MRKWKKWMSIAVTAVLLTAAAGCGQPAPEESAEPENKEEAANVEADDDVDTDSGNEDEGTAAAGTDTEVSGKLVIWEHGTSFEDALIELIDGFQEQYPDVEVEYEIKSDNYYSLLTTAIQSGEAPDIFWTNGTATEQMYTFAEEGVLYDLTGKVDLEGVEDDSLELAMIDDALYSIPWMTYDTRACYYNKDLFEEMGLEIPGTFSEFEDMLQTIADNGKIPISLAGIDSWGILFFFEPLLSAMEPEYTRGLADYSSKADDERVGNVLNKALEWADKGYFGDGFLGVDGDGASLAFTTGEAVMTVNGSWMITSFQENNPNLNFGAFQIPTEEGTTGMVGTFSNGFSVYDKTEYPEAALAFVNYCASLEAQTNWVQTMGAVSGSPKIESSNEIANEIADCEETFISWQANLGKYNLEGESATSIWEEDSTNIFSGGITVEQLLQNIGEVMQ